MTAAELCELIPIAIARHPLLTDVHRVPGGPLDTAVLHVADRDALLWRIVVEPRP